LIEWAGATGSCPLTQGRTKIDYTVVRDEAAPYADESRICP